MKFEMYFYATFSHAAKNLKLRNFSREKSFGPTKYSPEKILNPQNIHEKKLWTHKKLTRKIFDPCNTLKGAMARWH